MNLLSIGIEHFKICEHFTAPVNRWAVIVLVHITLQYIEIITTIFHIVVTIECVNTIIVLPIATLLLFHL